MLLPCMESWHCRLWVVDASTLYGKLALQIMGRLMGFIVYDKSDNAEVMNKG